MQNQSNSLGGEWQFIGWPIDGHLESVQIFDTVHNSHNSVSDPLTHGTARDWISAVAVQSSRNPWAGRIIAKISLSA